MFWDFKVVSQRFALLFVASNWILIPEIILLFKNKEQRVLLLFVLFMYCSYKLYKDVEHSPWLAYVTYYNEIDYATKAAPLKRLGF